MAGYFITGTDTDVGKTWATVALMRRLQQRGATVVGMKPVAAGCEWSGGRWKNQDALLLQQNASLALDYASINPYAFALPVSPHLACGDTEVGIDIILNAFNELQRRSDYVLVEGAGGWYSPLGKSFDNADLAVALQLPVIMVVGVRLGCINHARLTFRAIQQQSAVVCAGWVAVEVEPFMAAFQDNVAFLRDSIGAPLLGVLPHLPRADFDFLAARLEL